MICETTLKYRADIAAGSLKLPESRLIADLQLRQVDAEGWKDAIITKNVLQARNPATASRLTRLIRGRLETMGPELWKLVRDGKGTVAAHAVLAAAVKRSPLLGDFLEIVVAEQYRLINTDRTQWRVTVSVLSVRSVLSVVQKQGEKNVDNNHTR